MKKYTVLLLLGCIFLLGIFLRFYQLGAIPNSLNWDEVSWGYNAYSVATTGRDEYGNFLPLTFKAFGDYKQPVYVYLDALPTLLWGLSAFAVRFPSALFGSFSILSVFFLTRELFRSDKKHELFALLAAGLFAISPWSIQFSRVAFEANIGVFFSISGVALFLYGLRVKKMWCVLLATVVMSLSCYTYHSQKLFTPLLFISLLFYTRDFLWTNKKYLSAVLVVFFFANILWLADSRTTTRGRSVVFTSHQTEILAEPTKKLIADRANRDIIGEVLHNRRIVYANIYLRNYLKHFDPNFLFSKGDNARHHSPFMGVEYLVALPFILIGMGLLWKRYRTQAVFLFGWLLLAPIASSLAIDAPNASRSMVFLPLWQIFASVGIISCVLFCKKYSLKLFVSGIIGVIYFLSFLFYSHNYFAHTDKEFALYWQYGYREAVQQTAGKRVFFASDIEQPYIFYLFYSGILPSEYIQTGGSNRLQEMCYSINSAYFGKCSEKIESGDIIVTSKQTISGVSIAKKAEILYPNDEVAIRFFTVK